MSIQTSSPVPLDDIDYPSDDGNPMSEHTIQYRWIVTIQGNFERLYRDRADVFVAGDLLWYPVEGDRLTRSAPDVMIVFGRPKLERGSYMQWLEGGIAPQVVWEVLSPGNRAGEMEDKFEFFQRYGVEEYYLYDPHRGELHGWVREGDELRPIAQIQGWTSPRTGVRMELTGLEVGLTHPDGQRFLTFAEWVDLGEQERREKEAAEARAEQERREKEAAVTRAEQERLEKEAAEARAEQERREKEAAVARAEQLAAKVRALGIDPDAV